MKQLLSGNKNMLKRLKLLLTLFIMAVLIVPQVSYAQVRTAAGLRASFADVIKDTAPAVVNIYATKVVQGYVNPLMNDPFYEMFFGQQAQRMPKERVEQSLGSGVIVRSDGIAVTNHHVIQGAAEIRVIFNDGREMPARILEVDKQTDLAVLKIERDDSEPLPFLRFGNSDSVQVGDIALAIGNPFGVGQSVSMGIVSAIGRATKGPNGYGNFIQTDAAINPGNSGGALVDSRGNLIGINSAIYTRTGSSIGISFAMPANTVRTVIESVLRTGEVQRPWFGARGQDLNMLLAEKLGLRAPRGVLINEIYDASPASRAGIRIGDVITSINGTPITDSNAFDARIGGMPANSTVTLGVWREGRSLEVEVKLEPLPERRPVDRWVISGDNPLEGYAVEHITPKLAQEYNMQINASGLMVVDTPQTNYAVQFYGLGMQKGDILVSVNRQEVNTINQLRNILNRRARSWEIVYKRGGRMFRAVLSQ